MKSLVIIGSSGSIGRSTLQLVAAHPERYRVAGLAVHHASELLLEQAVRFGVKRLAVAAPWAAGAIRDRLPPGTTLLEGPEGVVELAASCEADMLVAALVGMAGLQPVLAAIEAGLDIALATKEVLVAAGNIVMAAAARRGVAILPIDSEHSAIFQALQSESFTPRCVRSGSRAGDLPAEERLRRLILTASGGPFATRPEVDFSRVTVAEALNHPKWAMGRKISVDSATMMNKGLEVIEACWLFNLPPTAVDVVVHPESIIHSLVEFNDGALLAQLSQPDMRLAINYALSWPERLATDLPTLDLAALRQLNFTVPDPQRFPALRLAREAIGAGGTMTTVLNGANEVAVAAFLDEKIAFNAIWQLTGSVMARHQREAADDLETILAADAWARRIATELIAKA